MRYEGSRLPKRRRAKGPIIVLALLLVVPVWALIKLGHWVDWRLIAGYLVAISASTYLVYRHDKRRAQAAGQRTPEKTLHLLEILGGWPAAFIAQRAIRHKIVKRNYQIAFAGIIAAHELIAVDFIRDWQLATGIVEQVLKKFL